MPNLPPTPHDTDALSRHEFAQLLLRVAIGEQLTPPEQRAVVLALLRLARQSPLQKGITDAAAHDTLPGARLLDPF